MLFRGGVWKITIWLTPHSLCIKMRGMKNNFIFLIIFIFLFIPNIDNIINIFYFPIKHTSTRYRWWIAVKNHGTSVNLQHKKTVILVKNVIFLLFTAVCKTNVKHQYLHIEYQVSFTFSTAGLSLPANPACLSSSAGTSGTKLRIKVNKILKNYQNYFPAYHTSFIRTNVWEKRFETTLFFFHNFFW